jgi:hypothetical protein
MLRQNFSVGARAGRKNAKNTEVPTLIARDESQIRIAEKAKTKDG